MLTFAFARSFKRSLKGLHPQEKAMLQGRIDTFMLAMDTQHVPGGFGLKKLGGDIWEFRTDLAIRVLFRWSKSEISFLFVGNHNEIRLFMKHYLS